MSTNQQLNKAGVKEEEGVVLISVVGMSPAVVTESIWGLHLEHPELVPDEVVVYTTRLAWDNMQKALTASKGGVSVWEDLQQKVGKSVRLRKRIFEDTQGGELADIVTSADQELVADQLLRGIREFKNPQQGKYRVVASVAGGRKSMSALMYAAMSLGAEADDLITHVLAEEVATSCPEFFFPAQEKQELVNRKGEAFTAAGVQIEMAEIPFVPLASLVKQTDFKPDGCFTRLVKRAREVVTRLSPEETKIRLSMTECKVRINGQELKLDARPYTLMAILVTHATLGNEPLNSELARDILCHLRAKKKLPAEILGRMEENEKKADMPAKDRIGPLEKFYVAAEWEGGFPDGFAKAKSELKKTLEKNGFDFVAADAFGRGRFCFQCIRNVKIV